jgi:hypothetical protein
MADISIDLQPDPEKDKQARRGALALVTATLYEAGQEQTQVQELSSAALRELIEQVVGDLSEVRPESAAALQHMLSVVARQYSGFAALTYLVAAEAFTTGQREPEADGLDVEQVLRTVSAQLEALPE